MPFCIRPSALGVHSKHERDVDTNDVSGDGVRFVTLSGGVSEADLGALFTNRPVSRLSARGGEWVQQQPVAAACRVLRPEIHGSHGLVWERGKDHPSPNTLNPVFEPHDDQSSSRETTR